LNNAAEMAIVRDGETGFIARSIEESVSLLQMLLSSPDMRERVSRNAIDRIAETRTPDQSVRDFMIVWLGMLGKTPTHCDFRAAIGDSRRIGCRDPVSAWSEMEIPKLEQRATAVEGHAGRISKASLPAMCRSPVCGVSKSRLAQVLSFRFCLLR